MIAAALRRIFPPPCAIATHEAGDEHELDPLERAAVQRAMPERRREFAAGRAAARTAFAELGLPAMAVVAGADRAPQWPSGVIGSIAHAQGVAVAAVARTDEVAAIGVDLERDRAVRTELWAEVLRVEEVRWVRGRPASERDRWATVLFCIKEAFYKFQYPRTHAWLEFTAVRVDLDTERGRFSIGLPGGVEIDYTRLYNFEGGFAFAGSFVVAGLYLPSSFRA